MLGSLAALLVAQLTGEILSQSLRLPLPGPVVGMLLLLAFLLARRGVPPALDRTAGTLLGYLSLLFVPAGVGVVRYLGVIEAQWFAIAISIVVSTAMTMLVTAGVMHALERPTR